MLPASYIRQLLERRVARITALLATAFLASMCGSADGDGDTGQPGDGQHCAVTNDFSSLVVTLPDRTHGRCVSGDSGAFDETETVEGVVHNAPDGSIVINSCLPGTGCEPTGAILSVSTDDEHPPLPLAIPDGTFVQLTLQSKRSGGIWSMCKSRILIRNLPTWGGAPNPTSGGSFFWMAEHFSYNEEAYSWPDDPFLVERELACDPSGATAPYYAWRFSSPDSPGSEVVAYMGETATWSVADGELAGQYEARNLQATVGGGHNYYGYWIVRK